MKKIILTALFVLGIFICMLDTTILNVSLPNIGEHLNVGLDSLSWALNIYLILFASLTIPLTRIAEIVGVHKSFLFGVLLFGLGSIISACSSGLSVLLMGRAIQSIGASVIFPLSMTLGIGLVSIEKRTGMIALLGITQGLAAAIGPVVGGIVTQFMGWRWIFLINVPLTILMILVGVTNLNVRNEVQYKQAMDIWGAVLIMITLAALSLGMMQGRVWGWTSLQIIGCFLIGSVGFLLFILIEYRSKNPMIPLALFLNRNFTVSSLIIILSNLFLVATTVILPTYFTNIEGFNTLHSSFLVSPISLAILIFSPISGFLEKYISAKWLLLLGFTIMFCGYSWLSYGALTNQTYAISAGFAIGMGYGTVTGPILIIAAGNLKGKLLVASQSVTGVLRQIGSMLAVAIFVTGLYGNLTVARNQSKSYAQNQIIKTNLPVEQQKKLLSRINKHMDSTQFVKSDLYYVPEMLKQPIQNVEKKTHLLLRKAFESLYLTSIPFILFAGLISLLIKNKKIDLK
ncbi:MFS transporter [Leuconostoc litchii]|uniref:DHA2 family efflux MFS transporter permease subunit n=1 Tax=Leuconostoc litchii TaxID=1981069 RepID=A0A6P2CKL7_9LACO|nr:DHA2 family efflux MFS transporter permease subunit [Leuconostoc litchii]TYC46279.1 DHA2 family efflux MFS transporter permease subunit [Leuconostoc litchii]GMA69991.1 MFS transporter [Leuconostoc litchii]